MVAGFKVLSLCDVEQAQFRELWLYNVEAAKSDRLTDGLAHVDEPTFDANGKYLYFLASTDAGPVVHWFDQSGADSQATMSVFMIVLDKKTPNPLLKENDEEEAKSSKDDKAEKTTEKDQESKTPSTVFDFEGVHSRVLSLPIKPGDLGNLLAGKEGKLYYIRRVGRVPG